LKGRRQPNFKRGGARERPGGQGRKRLNAAGGGSASILAKKTGKNSTMKIRDPGKVHRKRGMREIQLKAGRRKKLQDKRYRERGT